jgi:hypothetical protein
MEPAQPAAPPASSPWSREMHARAGEESARVGVEEDLGVAPRGRWKNDGKKERRSNRTMVAWVPCMQEGDGGQTH